MLPAFDHKHPVCLRTSPAIKSIPWTASQPCISGTGMLSPAPPKRNLFLSGESHHWWKKMENHFPFKPLRMAWEKQQKTVFHPFCSYERPTRIPGVWPYGQHPAAQTFGRYLCLSPSLCLSITLLSRSFFDVSLIGAGSQGLWRLSTAFPVPKHVAGLPVEWPGHQPELIRDAGICKVRD